jgi:hypothetical protein
MTLYDLENQGLLMLPANDSWEKVWRGEETSYRGDLKDLKLVYVNVWGKTPNDEDDRFLLQAIDDKSNYYTTEITQIDETVSRFYLSVFGIENYGKSIADFYDSKLEIDEFEWSTSLFEKVPA